jgi:D-xylose transport system substrate-binding protein
MSVYKATEKEANAASKLAISLLKGQTPTEATDKVNNGQKDIPSVLLDPVPVTKDNIKKYVGQIDFPTKEQICAGKVAAACTKAGL